jgi:hypothetical protein
LKLIPVHVTSDQVVQAILDKPSCLVNPRLFAGCLRSLPLQRT